MARRTGGATERPVAANGDAVPPNGDASARVALAAAPQRRPAGRRPETRRETQTHPPPTDRR